MRCPRCHYTRQELDAGVIDGVCPACGIAYAKWLQAQADAAPGAARAPAHDLPDASADSALVLPVETRWQRLYLYTCFMPSDRHESALWGHLVVWMCFTFWGLRFIAHGVDWSFIGTSFLHNVNLPFHEYGHVAFSPFGRFWTLLGGSLFQIVLPLFPLLAFMVLQRDNFAASIMLWWSGQNFIDVAPYIADAPIRALPLTASQDSHDWWNLLGMTGTLDHAGLFATLCFAIGSLIMLLGSAWGAHLLWIEFKGRTAPGNGT